MSLQVNLKELGSVDLNVSIDSILLEDGALTLLGRKNGSPLKLKVAFGPEDDTQGVRDISEILRSIMKQYLRDGNYLELQRNTLEWATQLTYYKGP